MDYAFQLMKIPVFCSLLPTELILALGHDVHFVTAEELASHTPQEYHCAFHENLCSYSKALYDYFIKGDSPHSEGGLSPLIIIPTSCDAMKKLYNSLHEKIPNVYLLNVPQNKSELAAGFLVGEFERLVKRLGKGNCASEIYACHPRENGDPAQFNALDSRSPLTTCGDKFRGNDTTSRTAAEVNRRNDTHGAKIGILGANVPLKVLETCLDKFGFQAVYLNHCLVKSYPDAKLLELAKNENIKEYAAAFLEKNTCPRSSDYLYKETLKKRIIDENIKGLIVNTLKFCDFHSFDYKYFKETLNMPMLLVEHELTANYEGQIMTRLEAFFESIKSMSLRAKQSNPVDTGDCFVVRLMRRTPSAKRLADRRNDRRGSYFIGIDSGSHATKLVCIGRDKNILYKEVLPTGTSVKKSVENVLKNLEINLGIKNDDIACIVGTGYGRNNIGQADKIITEISCHARGAHHLLERAATVIDIGGQDSKAIKIDDTGHVIRFAMNDKCAAGTGRFLEVMADKLEMSLEEFAQLALNAGAAVPISSMCSVFAESEVISLIAGGASKESIAKGIHRSIAERTISLAKRIESRPPYFMAGGVAKNKGLVRELENCLGEKITVINEPQFTGALGAALFALGETLGSGLTI